MLQPKADKVPQGLQGPHPRRRQGRHDAELRQFGLKATGAGAHHRAPDRSGPPRDHPPHEARRPRLDPRVPGRAGVEEACRSPHGLRARVRRNSGPPREAGPHHVRDRRRAVTIARRRSSWPPPSCRSRRASSRVGVRTMADGDGHGGSGRQSKTAASDDDDQLDEASSS
jgi:hypothetical protein